MELHVLSVVAIYFDARVVTCLIDTESCTNKEKPGLDHVF